MMNPPSPLKNQRGLLTLDFVFASVLVFGFSAVLFSFAMTLSVVEVIQYISFASARNYTLAHLNPDKQRERAQLKFDELSNHPVLVPMISTGWFAIEPAQIGDFNDEFQPDRALDTDIFVGVRIPTSAPILYKRIPLIGTTGTDRDGFRANVQSFLGREPSFDECRQFMNERAQQMSNLGYNFSSADAHLMMDNGC